MQKDETATGFRFYKKLTQPSVACSSKCTAIFTLGNEALFISFRGSFVSFTVLHTEAIYDYVQ